MAAPGSHNSPVDVTPPSVPAAAALGDLPLLGERRHDAIQVVLLDPHRVGELGDGDAGARLDQLERLHGARAAAARAAAAAEDLGVLLVAPLVPTPESARSAASRRVYSSTSGLSSFRRAWISLRFSSRKSAICGAFPFVC